MSTVATSQQPSEPSESDERIDCECAYCQTHFWKDEGYSSNYCSYKCRSLAAATGLLDDIRLDHTRCASCFRKLKDIEDPDPLNDTTGVSVHDQVSPGTPDFCKYHTPKRIGGPTGKEEAEPGYEWAIGEAFRRTDPVNGDFSSCVVGEESTKVCECGVTHHQTVNFDTQDTEAEHNFRDKLSKSELNERAARLYAYLEDREDCDWQLNRRALFAKIESMKTHDDLSKRAVDWEILEYSLAKAIREADY